MLSLESKFGPFRLLRRCLGGLLEYDLRAEKARSVYLFLSVLGSSRIFRLIGFSARFAVERIEEPVAVRGALHPPLAAPVAEEIALAMANFDEPVHPGQQTGGLQRLQRDADRVPVTLCGRGNSLVGGKAPFAAVGVVEAP